VSLPDVIVGGLIGTAGTVVVTFASWRREARARDRALRVELSRAAVELVTLVRSAATTRLKGDALDKWATQMNEVRSSVVRDIDEVLAVGGTASIQACELMLRAVLDTVESLATPEAEIDKLIRRIQRARVEVLAPGRRGWWRRRKILAVFRRTPD
jgi:hypothetical protein